MARILMVGIDPDEVDYSDPSLPPGMDAEKIRQGIAQGFDDLRSAGHDVQRMYVPQDPSGLDVLAAKLTAEAFECVMIGGGVRLPPRNLALFEAVLNVVAASAFRPKIALVARPDEAAQAVGRVLGNTAASGPVH